MAIDVEAVISLIITIHEQNEVHQLVEDIAITSGGLIGALSLGRIGFFLGGAISGLIAYHVTNSQLIPARERLNSLPLERQIAIARRFQNLLHQIGVVDVCDMIRFLHFYI